MKGHQSLEQQLEKAGRLAEIAQKVGFTLWQVQELEGIAIQCLGLFEAPPGVLTSAQGRALLEELERKSFAAIIKQLVEKAQLEPTLRGRFDSIREERNWLVHRSRADSRSAVHHDADRDALLQRLQVIADEALSLMKELEGVALARTIKATGVSVERINDEAMRTLASWRASKSAGSA